MEQAFKWDSYIIGTGFEELKRVQKGAISMAGLKIK